MAKLSRLVLIADRFTEECMAARAAQAVEGGVRWVHLRDQEADAVAFRAAARRIATRLRAAAPDVLLSVNTRLGVAQEVGAGLHLGARGPTVAAARRALGAEALIGFSAHSLGEAQAAAEAGADYLFFSPVFPTTSKPGHPGAGRAALRKLCAAVPVPVFALGGITPARAGPCLDAGAQGVAVLSGLLHAEDPTAAAQAYADAFPWGRFAL